MITPEMIAILGIMVSSAVFYIYVRGINKEKLTIDGFMVANSNLGKTQFGSTFAASSFSLAINTMFLFLSSNDYKVFMIVSPVTYLLGHYLFIGLIKKADVDVNDCRTVSDLAYKFFASKSIARLITFMTLTSYIMLVFVELYIGTVVLTFFLPQSLFFQTFSFLAIGIIVLLYVRLGGYKALVKTDKWQLFLMMLATSLISVFALIIPTVNGAETNDILMNMLTPTKNYSEIFTFALWATIINLLIPFSQVANWQRVSAAKDNNISWTGLIYGTRHVLLLFLLTLFGFILLRAKGYDLNSLIEFLELVKSSGWLSSYIIFPLMIVGFCSMVFSSADVAIISIAYALCDKNSYQKEFSNMDEKTLRRTLTLLIGSILLVLSIIYWFQCTALKDWLLPLIYVVIGQLAILTPIPMLIVLRLIKYKGFRLIEVNKIKLLLFFNGILLAWFILLGCSYLSKVTGNPIWSQLSIPLSSTIVFLVAWINSPVRAYTDIPLNENL